MPGSSQQAGWLQIFAASGSKLIKARRSNPLKAFTGLIKISNNFTTFAAQKFAITFHEENP
jgi:hypothetical protein